MNAPRMPTADECSAHASVPVYEGLTGVACWYPQMGGYASRCVITFHREDGPDGCFEAYVWHDGEFPFGEDDWHGPAAPRHLHHCRARQFSDFGAFVAALQVGA